MIPVREASERILSRFAPLPGETVATGKASGRTLSQAIVTAVDSPPWDNSSMDGYAVRSADIGGDLPVTLDVVEEVAAGRFPSRDIGAGKAMRVMTGAPVPAGADTVIRREDTDDGRHTVVIHAARDTGRNIRRKGEDFTAGSTLFARGETLGAAHVGALASAGIREVEVHRRPRIAFISSGDELVELDGFTPALAGRKIVSSNSVTLGSLIEQAGGVAVDLGIALDTPDSLRQKFSAVRDADLVITTAGISVGDHDHVRDVFDSLGGMIDFWKVRMRPGAPMAFGMLGAVPWIGLSGNPVSAIVTFEVFVRPAIRRMQGMRDVFRRTIPVTLAHPVTLAAPLMHFLRVVVTTNPEGEYMAALGGSQSSGVLTAMARSNALLILPGDKLQFEAGETHRALPFGEAVEAVSELKLT